MARGEMSSFQPFLARTKSAGGIMVSDQTQYTSVSGNPCCADRPASAPQTPHSTTVIRA